MSHPKTRREIQIGTWLAGKWAQRRAELSRLPALVGQVAPELIVSRLQHQETWLHLLQRQAQRRPAARALGCAGKWLDYASLWQSVERAAGYLSANGVRPGQAVGLLGSNSLEYAILLLGAARLGAPVALVASELDGELLTRAVERAGCQMLLCELRLAGRARASVTVPVLPFDAASLERELARSAPLATPLAARGHDDFAYVYTSGTTGRSRPCRVSHRKARLAATAFGKLVHRLRPSDVVYCALPLYHASPLLLGLGATFACGASIVLRERFSASELLADVRRYEATVLLYVGELGRALLSQPPTPRDREHRLRLALGNGLSREVWLGLQRRFGIPEIREFFAATEFPGAIVNLTGTPGSVGHLPLGRLRGYRLVRIDANSLELARDANGFARECDADEPGELLLRLKPTKQKPNGDYLGYLGEAAGRERVVRDVFRAGDLYCRTGDLLRRNAAGEYFFVDRLGDTFRFKGENVSTREVEELLSRAPGVQQVAVVGISVPNIDGKLGLAALETGAQFSVEEFARTAQRLPSHARPAFVRCVSALELTASLKLKKRGLSEQGVDPERIADPLYYRSGGAYLPLTASAWAGILRGELRL